MDMGGICSDSHFYGEACGKWVVMVLCGLET